LLQLLHQLSWEADTEAKTSLFETELDALHSLPKDILYFASWTFGVEGIQSYNSWLAAISLSAADSRHTTAYCVGKNGFSEAHLKKPKPLESSHIGLFEIAMVR